MEHLFGGGFDDVVVNIFIELPSGDLDNCRRVCKLWRRVVDLILRDVRLLGRRRRLIEARLLRNCRLVTLDKGRSFQVHRLGDQRGPAVRPRLPQFPKPVAFQTVIKVFDSSALTVLTGSGSWTLDAESWTSSGRISSLSPQWLSTFTASYSSAEVFVISCVHCRKR